jgi:putative NADH-flavin reductase
MKLTIFGASGGTGKLLVEQALARGHDVTAFVRNSSKLGLNHPRLKIEIGQLSDKAIVDNAISGSDAVLSTLGPRMSGGPKNSPITSGIQNIIAAMKVHNVRRLVISWGPSIPSPNDKLSLFFRVLFALIKVMASSALKESAGVDEALRSSDRDWTVVRVFAPNNGPKKGKVRLGYLGRGEVGMGISRADIAEFMLNQIEDTRYLRQSPVISN